MRKMYKKPEIMMETFLLSQHIAACDGENQLIVHKNAVLEEGACTGVITNPNNNSTYTAFADGENSVCNNGTTSMCYTSFDDVMLGYLLSS